jgi:pSer/pThr/pTyr-binding forkhead associated (FHA) protein
MAYLTVRIKGVEGYSRVPLDKERMVVGRSSTCDIPIKHSSISREHCALVRGGTVEAPAWRVEDLGSANGTLVNKAKVPGQQNLNERDIIALGQARLTFHTADASEVEAAIDINLGEGADGPVRKRGAEDPPEAVPCSACGTWLSIAHRVAGEHQPCPRCKADNIVPNLVS